MNGGYLGLKALVGTAVLLVASAVLPVCSYTDTDPSHPDPRHLGVGVIPEHATWSVSKLEEQIRLHPKSALAYLELGNAQMLDGDTEDSMSNFNRAIALDPRCGKAYIGRYSVYCSQSQFRQALAELKKAYEIGPHDLSMDALNLQATLHKELKQFPEALGEFTRVIEANIFSKRRLSYVYMQRGVVQDRLGKIDAAISDFTASAKLDPTLGQAFLYRGNDYRGKGDYKRALADYGHLLTPVKDETGMGQVEFPPTIRRSAYRDRAILYSTIKRPDLAKADRMAAFKYDREDMDLMPFRGK